MRKPPKEKESENDEDGWSRFLDSIPPVEQQVLEIKSSLPVICDTYTWVPRFLLTLRVSQSVRQACLAAGISREMVRRVKNAHPEFARAMADAEEDATDWYVEEARRRALTTSDMLLWNMLKAHRPEIYREAHGVKVLAGIRVEINGKERIVESVDDLTTDEMRLIASGSVTIEGDATALFGDDDEDAA